jgi:polysaccharide export outer membrane protein
MQGPQRGMSSRNVPSQLYVLPEAGCHQVKNMSVDHRIKSFVSRTIGLAVLFISCQMSYGQAPYGQISPEKSRTQVSASATRGKPEQSELAEDNFSRVAASSSQIREVLLVDTGLLVELKRWIAKEATDEGRIVEDQNLTDQAIFDRLDRDQVFRSVATRLLQRYGYLMPKPNPDSALGKQQELILKERVKRFVALEAEEDTLLLHPEKKLEEVERATACDAKQDENCETPAPPQSPELDRALQDQPQIPPDSPPLPLLPPDISPLSEPRTLRSGSRGDEPDLNDRSMSGFELTSSTTSAGGGMLGMMGNGPSSPTIADMMSSRGNSDLADRYDAAQAQSSASNNVPQQSVRPRKPRPRRSSDDEVNPVKMVKPANPYGDIPSLYDLYTQASSVQKPAERFGSEVFRNAYNQPGFIPMDLPVGPDYVVGPGDSLAIDLWGGYSQRLVRLVDRTGRVSLPESGPLLVSGKSLGEVQLAVQRVLRSQFRDVSADVSVSRLRTIRIYIVGEVAEAGAYDISSLSTPLNALVAAGGVSDRGSLRTIKHYRGKQLIQEVDAYDLLLHGVRSDLQQLQSGDTLLVPPVGPLVTVEGMVRRPAIYELRDETSLAQVLELAGGILPTAALRHVEVQRVEVHEKRTMLSLNLTSTGDTGAADQQLTDFKVRGGDRIHLFPIASYNEDAIYLQGHVLRPGRYSYKKGMKLSDLIASYGDLLPEPAPHYGEIVRLNAPDFHPTVESFDLASALATPASAPTLQPLDTVRIFSRYDFQAPPDVWVGGEVRSPGKYRTSGQAHLRDAVYLAGGTTPYAALDSAQLFRTEADGSTKILSVNLREALAGNPAHDVLLQPRDRVLINKNPENVEPPTVYIKGEVAKPGRYPLTSNMRVEDLVKVAGGLKRSAYADKADLTRFAASGPANSSSEHLEVKLASAAAGETNEDLPLRNGDVLTIGQLPQWSDLGASVTVRGEVLHPASYGIQPGERLSSILRRSGGFTAEAYPYGAVLARREVRDIEMKSQTELVQRLKDEQVHLNALPEGDADQKNAKLTVIAQTQTALQQLETTPPIGRVVIRIPADMKKFANSASDITLRDGDQLIIPKKATYVMVQGQVFNPTALTYVPGRDAKWYLGQAGGVTQIADKSAMFVVRADGSVLSAKNNSGFWSGDPMKAVLKPGDSIIVPERALRVGPRNWTTLIQTAQVVSSIALTVAYIHP